MLTDIHLRNRSVCHLNRRGIDASRIGESKCTATDRRDDACIHLGDDCARSS